MAASAERKLMKEMKFPSEFSQKVDITKVNVEVLKTWIKRKIEEILGIEDDVVVDLCYNLLEGQQFPDPKSLQIQLTGFLETKTASFCQELWNLCLSAQSSPQGVPKELLEAKKKAMAQEKLDAEAAAEKDRRRREEEARDRDIESIRQRERGERGWGRGRGHRGFRSGRDSDRRSPRRVSRSPPRRRRGSDDYRGPPIRREVDTYVPGGDRRRDIRGRARSPTPRRRATSRSRSPSNTPQKYRRRSRDRSRSRPRPSVSLRQGTRHASRDRSRSRSLGRGGRRRRSPRGGHDRERSFTPTERSRSRSPRRDYRRKGPSYKEALRNFSPRREENERRHLSRSRSRSTDRSASPIRERTRSGYKRHRSLSISDHDNNDTEADARKRLNRYNRSPRRSLTGDNSHSPSRSPPRRYKRQESVGTFESEARPTRNTSSYESSSPARTASTASADEGKKPVFSKERDVEMTSPPQITMKAPAIKNKRASELREKLLRAKLMAARRNSQTPNAVRNESGASVSHNDSNRIQGE